MEKINVLLVDDQPGNLLSCQAILGELGANLISARSGRQALQFLLKQDIALILLDVIMPEMDGFETATLIRQNPRLEQTPIIFITAMSRSELDCRKGYELGAVDYIFAPLVPEVLRAKVSIFMELYRKRRDLQKINRILSQTNAALVAEIAERKRAEAALHDERALLAQRVEERTRELQRANEGLAKAGLLKDEFLANMSHELRTPLNSILGLSEALQEHVYGRLSEKQLLAVANVEESSRHLLALINDVLDLSKIAAGKLELHVAPCAVEQLCSSALRFIHQMAERKQLEVCMNVGGEATALEADERLLKQILVNLLSNAVKFTPEGGAIGLEVAGCAAQAMMQFTVWDQGIGIADEDVERLFQPFVQLDSRLSRQYSGTGLGLALARRLAELHGGRISIESATGKGSRFTVSLPWRSNGAIDHAGRTEAAAVDQFCSWVEQQCPPAAPAREFQPAKDEQPADSPFQPELPKVLLVEDNESSLRTMSDYLRAKNYGVVVAQDGNEALAYAREYRPDAILMDVQMPGMDGLEAMRRIRAEAGLSGIPIIALTALAMRGDRERCLAAGANDYMSKPVSLKKLVEMIETQIHEHGKSQHLAGG